MAYSNQTTHYGLPLPVGSDKSSWLDNNTAFAAIDTAIYQASTDAGAAAGDIALLQNDVTSLQSGKQDVLTFDATPTNGSLNPVRSGGVYSSIESVSIALGVTDLKVSALGSAMGNTDISAIGDGTVTGAIDTINSKAISTDTVTITSTYTTDSGGATLGGNYYTGFDLPTGVTSDNLIGVFTNNWGESSNAVVSFVPQTSTHVLIGTSNNQSLKVRIVYFS